MTKLLSILCLLLLATSSWAGTYKYICNTSIFQNNFHFTKYGQHVNFEIGKTMDLSIAEMQGTRVHVSYDGGQQNENIFVINLEGYDGSHDSFPAEIGTNESILHTAMQNITADVRCDLQP